MQKLKGISTFTFRCKELLKEKTSVSYKTVNNVSKRYFNSILYVLIFSTTKMEFHLTFKKRSRIYSYFQNNFILQFK